MAVAYFRVDYRDSLQHVVERFSQDFGVFLLGEGARDIEADLVDGGGGGVGQFCVGVLILMLLDECGQLDDLWPRDGPHSWRDSLPNPRLQQ